jgi:plasmid stability protein
MHTITVKVSLPDELRERFEARVQEHGGDQERYVREVLERDLTGERPHPELTFREIFAPSQEGFTQTGLSDEDLAEAVEAEVKLYRAERRARELRDG